MNQKDVSELIVVLAFISFPGKATSGALFCIVVFFFFQKKKQKALFSSQKTGLCPQPSAKPTHSGGLDEVFAKYNWSVSIH
jgi:hypothetical protein